MVRGVVRGAERRRVVRLKWLRLSYAALLLLLVEAVVAASCFLHNPSGRGFEPHPPHKLYQPKRDPTSRSDALMTRSKPGRRRSRGTVDELPSGALRVRVYAGKDPVTGRRRDLVEVIPSGPKAAGQAEEALTRLLGQVDEQRQPRTSITVNQLLDQHVEMSTWEHSTRETYIGYANKHIRPLIGTVQVGALDARVFDSFHAELRRCRDHCGRKRYVDHRTPHPHECDSRCRMHQCRPLGAATIRQIHFILSGALKRAVRWGWVTTNPIIRAETPPVPKAQPGRRRRRRPGGFSPRRGLIRIGGRWSGWRSSPAYAAVNCARSCGAMSTSRPA